MPEQSIPGGVPDFEVAGTFGGLALEVTKATDPGDERARVDRRRSGVDVHFLGEDIEMPDGRRRSGGRFGGGTLGDEYEIAMARDIRDAIQRKAVKDYAKNGLLLIYADSNAWPAKKTKVLASLRTDQPAHPLREVFVLFNSGPVAELRRLSAN